MEVKVNLSPELVELIIDELLTNREFKEMFARMLCEEALKDPTCDLHDFVKEMVESSKTDIERQVDLTVKLLKIKYEN